MSKIKKMNLVVLLMLAFALLTPLMMFAQGGKDKPEYHYQWSVAPTDGSWYVLASAFWDIWRKEIPELEVTILPGGGHGNVISVGERMTEMGMASSTDISGAYHGVIPFENEQYKDIRMLMTLNSEAMYTVTWKKNTNLNTLLDIRGTRVNVKPKGYSSHELNKIVFKAAGLDMDRDMKSEYLGDDEAIQLMQDNQLDVLMSGGSIPDSAYVELSLGTPIKILPYGDDIIEHVIQLNPGLFRTVLPAGTYNGVDKDVPVVGYSLAVFVHKDLPEDLIYKMVKAIDEHISEVYDAVDQMRGVAAKDLFKNIGVPYHPGAAKYINEKGY